MKIKVISSSKSIFEAEKIDEVYAPTSTGIVGILPHHTNLMATLEIGILKIRLGKESKKIVLNGGILQVANDEVLILADEAQQDSDLQKTLIEQAISNAQKKLSTKLEPAELIRLEKQLRYEKFKQDLLLS